jgi:hypothetical protein
MVDGADLRGERLGGDSKAHKEKLARWPEEWRRYAVGVEEWDLNAAQWRAEQARNRAARRWLQ